MKPDTFDFNPPFFLLQLYLLHHFINFLIWLWIEKLRKRLQFEKVLWNKKNKISRI